MHRGARHERAPTHRQGSLNGIGNQRTKPKGTKEQGGGQGWRKGRPASGGGGDEGQLVGVGHARPGQRLVAVERQPQVEVQQQQRVLQRG